MAGEVLRGQARHSQRAPFEITTLSALQGQTAERTIYREEYRRPHASLHLRDFRIDLKLTHETATETQELLAEHLLTHLDRTVEPATLLATQLTECTNRL